MARLTMTSVWVGPETSPQHCIITLFVICWLFTTFSVNSLPLMRSTWDWSPFWYFEMLVDLRSGIFLQYQSTSLPHLPPHSLAVFQWLSWPPKARLGSVGIPSWRHPNRVIISIRLRPSLTNHQSLSSPKTNCILHNNLFLFNSRCQVNFVGGFVKFCSFYTIGNNYNYQEFM